MDKEPGEAPFAPLPLLRSGRQAEILAAVLGDPTVEFSLSELAQRLGIPYPSVHREIDRAEQSGVVLSRRVRNLRLVRANVDSPYYASLADLLSKAFGPRGASGLRDSDR